MTKRNRNSTHHVYLSDATFSFKLVLGPAGAAFGFLQERMARVIINKTVRSIPGSIPAMNSLPMTLDRAVAHLTLP